MLNITLIILSIALALLLAVTGISFWAESLAIKPRGCVRSPNPEL
jgi:hypothetical protein